MPAESTTSPESEIILDTNIISYLSNEPYQLDSFRFLSELSDSNYKFSVSVYSVYEILKITGQNNVKSVLDLIGIFKRYEVVEQILTLAGFLQNLYGSKDSQRKYDDADCVIAITAFLNKMKVFTADREGFPYPFFTEKLIRTIYYKSKPGVTKSVNLYLLEPNFSEIESGIQKVVSKKVPKH